MLKWLLYGVGALVLLIVVGLWLLSRYAHARPPHLPKSGPRRH